jgi:hypothetical protein
MDKNNISNSLLLLDSALPRPAISSKKYCLFRPLVSLQSKNTNNAKSDFRFKELICLGP